MTTGRAALACHQSHVHSPNKSLCRPQSSSASRVTAAQDGFFILSQSGGPPRTVSGVLALRHDTFKPHLAGMGETVGPSPSICSLNRMPGLARRPAPNSNARLWTSLFTGRPVGFLELYPFLPDGALSLVWICGSLAPTQCASRLKHLSLHGNN
jgi:hypothetical protein